VMEHRVILLSDSWMQLSGVFLLPRVRSSIVYRWLLCLSLRGWGPITPVRGRCADAVSWTWRRLTWSVRSPQIAAERHQRVR
jgi:hypothetical protein